MIRTCTDKLENGPLLTMLRMIWNLPKPMALIAWLTVNVSSGTTPLEGQIQDLLLSLDQFCTNLNINK
jgi:hypothetical protein